MEEIVKGLIEIVAKNKESGLVLALCLFTTWVLGKQILKQMKWRDEWIEKLYLALIHNKKVMEDGAKSLDDVQNTVAEMDTDVHDMMNRIETDREIEARVAAELERKSRDYPAR